MIGSTWQKWDLHIHSPLTHQNNQYQNTTLEEFVDKIIEKDLALIGITNYFYFEDNELEQIREIIASKDANITVLGNLEFRLTQQNKDGEWINVHCIFAEHIKTTTINEIMSKFILATTATGTGHSVYCSQDSLKLAGKRIEDITVDFEKLRNHLNASLKFGIDFLIAVCPNGYGGFRPDGIEGRSLDIAIEIEKNGQIILGRKEDRNFFLKDDRYEGSLSKPVFVCSDAHSIASLGQGSCGIGDEYTWIKAKPTFEGLRQVVIEPEGRVQQTDDFIEKTYLKPYFKAVKISGTIFEGQEIKFLSRKIDLNKNMVAIIGGRGTGKSLFLDAMYSKFNTVKSSNARDVNVEELSITLDKGDGTEQEFTTNDDTYSYLHVSQGDIQTFSKKPDDLSDEIKKMLRISNEEYSSIFADEMAEIIGKYRSFVVDYWEAMDENGNKINTPNYQNNLIEHNTKLIGTLTSPQNEKLIQDYQLNSKHNNERNNFILQLKNLLSQIERNLNEINQDIDTTNKNPLTLKQIPKIDTHTTIESIKENITKYESEIIQNVKNNEMIVLEFQKQGIHQDISSLLNKVTEYQKVIDHAKLKLTEIEHKTKQYHAYVKRRSELSLEYKKFLQEKKLNIDSAFQFLKENKSHWNEEQNNLVKEMLQDIEIQGEVIFDVDKFYLGLESCLNSGKFRAKGSQSTIDRLKETFNVETEEDYFKLVSGEEIVKINKENKRIEDVSWQSEFFNKGGRFELHNYLFSPSSIKNYLYVNAVFTYKGKTVNKLSVGQRGTFYVSLKLATDPFGSPFVFDQPEDDLDNEFIMQQLVPLFRKIKKYRQVIIVTHNANLVVNTDVEQVIVANNDNEVISYHAGAIEDGNVVDDEGIRADICNILEGGSFAFEKREKKYGIQALA